MLHLSRSMLRSRRRSKNWPKQPEGLEIGASRHPPFEPVVDEFVAKVAVAAAKEIGRRQSTVMVLDHGCGSCELSEAFEGHEEVTCIGLDRHRGSLRSGCVAGAFQELPFMDASFDVVCSIEGVYSEAHPEASFAELERILTDHGVLLLTSLVSSPGIPTLPAIEIEAWSRLLSEHEFEALCLLDLTLDWQHAMWKRHLARWGEIGTRVQYHGDHRTRGDLGRLAVSSGMLGLYGQQSVISRTRRHCLVCRREIRS
jgi:SAM-dependent methyltransferase